MILLSPWAKVTTENKPSPKNYPYWHPVVAKLSNMGFEIHQLSVVGEPDVVGVHKRYNNLPIKQIEELLRECQTWMSVDTFLQHLAWSVGKPGVAIFGPSDPLIFGHPENTNLLKSRKYLRIEQFWWWSQCKADPEAFVSPEEVITAVLSRIPAKGQYRPHFSV